ncbi:helix-turn-helix domain-containing protein [Streptomyces xantholiticus]
MADSYSGPRDAEKSVVAAAARVRELAERLERDPDEVLSITRLAARAGAPVEIVRLLLAGRAIEERDVRARFTSRCQELKQCRKVSNAEIGKALGVSRSQASYLLAGERNASLEQCEAIAAFFDVRAQFLTATDHDALLDVLRDEERRMLEDLAAAEPALPADPEMERFLRVNGVRRIAARAAGLDDEHRRALATFVDGFVAAADLAPRRTGDQE